jgi:hypothetical protein
MQSLFPFGFPWPTALYLALFVVSLAVYTALMQYVLAGSILLFALRVTAIARRRAGSGSVRVVQPGSGLVQKVLDDWLLAVIGLAITASIAPLLLLQILYQREFSAACRLLFVRSSLAVLGLLIVFVLLYLLKRRSSTGRGALPQSLLLLAVSASLIFCAWAWTGIHVLGLHEAAWPMTSKSLRWIYSDAEVWPRLGYWITASFPILAVALGWQLHWGRRHYHPADLARASSRLQTLALLGLATSGAEAWLWQLWLPPPTRLAVWSFLALPYGLLVLAGMGIQASGWLSLNAGAQLTTRRLAWISTGAAMTILGAIVVREARRLAALDVPRLFEAHRQAAGPAGIVLLLGSLVATAALVAALALILRQKATDTFSKRGQEPFCP